MNFVPLIYYTNDNEKYEKYSFFKPSFRFLAV